MKKICKFTLALVFSFLFLNMNVYASAKEKNPIKIETKDYANENHDFISSVDGRVSKLDIKDMESGNLVESISLYENALDFGTRLDKLGFLDKAMYSHSLNITKNLDNNIFIMDVDLDIKQNGSLIHIRKIGEASLSLYYCKDPMIIEGYAMDVWKKTELFPENTLTYVFNGNLVGGLDKNNRFMPLPSNMGNRRINEIFKGAENFYRISISDGGSITFTN